jgi:hypothetical protein
MYQWHRNSMNYKMSVSMKIKIGDALHSFDFGENKKQKNRWAICICFNMCNEMSPMHIMNDTCTQLHTMRDVFFDASVHGTKSAFGRGSSKMTMELQKRSWALTRPPPPRCRLLPSANCPCMEVETQESAIQKCAPANTRGAIIPLHKRNGTTRARVATSREKRLICKIDHTWNRWN